VGDRSGVCRILVGKPEGKRSCGRPRHRWENNIKKNLKEVGCGGIDWIDLAQDRDRWWALVNAEMRRSKILGRKEEAAVPDTCRVMVVVATAVVIVHIWFIPYQHT
jgi:hypothetical protein